MKKLTSLLLAFAMLFSLAMPAMAAEGDTKTIYFDNTDGWTTVNAYAWNDSGNSLGEWPGTAMTKVEGTENIYSIEVSTAATKIIFNDGRNQTTDLTIPTDDKDLYSNGTWSVYGEGGIPTPIPPSGGGSANDTSHDVTATYTPSYEAKWGTSKDDLTNNGTLADAINAAGADRSITYIQLQKNVTTVTGYDIRGGGFTLDLNGKTLTSNASNDSFALRVNSGVVVTLTDTAGGGAVSAEGSNSEAILVQGGSLEIDGGSYTAASTAISAYNGTVKITGGTFTVSYGYAVYVSENSSVTIEDGTFYGPRCSVVVEGTATITGGTFSAGEFGHIAYHGGTLNLSEYDDLNGLTLRQQTGSDLTVSDENIKLPEGYVFKDGENTTVNTLVNGTVYTIRAESAADRTYNVTIANGITGGTVTVDKNTAKQGDTVTVIVEAEALYAYVVESLSVTNTTTGEAVEVNEADKTFVMPDSNVTVTASFEKMSVISAEITWGSMAFTYTDGVGGAYGAWSNDGSEDAGTVTVKNTGTIIFTASATYTSAGNFGITGSLDEAKTLASTESGIFTLTLSGAPNKALDGEKIGTVTIEIAETLPTVVTNEQELKDAVANGGYIKLGESFSIDSVDIYSYCSVTLDLNSQTLTVTGYGLLVHNGGTLHISNGTISGVNTVNNMDGTVSIEGCTLTADINAFHQENGIATLKDCTASGLIDAVGGTVTLYESITFGRGTYSDDYIGIYSRGGSVICHFNPEDNIHLGNATNNGDGTWTVN